MLGEQQVQGINYAYTLQGWLKAINPDIYTGGSFTLRPDSSNNVVAATAYNVLLNYFNGDYAPVSGVPGPDNGVSATLGAAYRPLYNGNISSMGVGLRKLDSALLYNYQYDQLNRLVGMDAWRRTGANWGTISATSSFQERIGYDPNGNILNYHRNGKAVTGLDMDKMRYVYTPGTNKLDHIYDTVPVGAYTTDIDAQDSLNYRYDSIGQLVYDGASRITNITWTVYGKIASITKGDTTMLYTYDPSGNRISKSVVHGVDTLTTWYARDASGNALSVYTYGDPAVHGKALTQSEFHVYGSSRLGILRTSNDVYHAPTVTTSLLPLLGTGDSLTFARGNKFFELTNHLGNVLSTISDKRFGVTPDSVVRYFIPDVVSANDYYPFGSLQPGRSYAKNGNEYRYGFNGQEKSDELKGSGNSYTAEFWEYDPRIGKRWNLDPRPDVSVSPYAAFGNNPILNTDPLGDTLSPSQMVEALRIANDEIRNAVKNSHSNFFAPGTNARLLGATNDYLIKNKILNVSDANDFIWLVGQFHSHLGSVWKWSPNEYRQLDEVVINNSEHLKDKQILDLTIGVGNNADALLRTFMVVSANVAAGEAAGAVGVPVGRGTVGPRINSNLQQSIVSAGTTRVGQWMSPGEFEAFNRTGIIPRSNALIKGPAGYEKQAYRGDFYVEFDVKTTLLKNKG